MGLGWNARTELYADQANGSVLGAVQQEGTVMQVNTINLVNRSRNRDAALAFVNHALSAEAQAAVARSMYYLPANSRVQLTPEQTARSRTDLGERIIDVDWVAFAPVNARLTQEWRRRVTPASSR